MSTTNIPPPVPQRPIDNSFNNQNIPIYNQNSQFYPYNRQQYFPNISGMFNYYQQSSDPYGFSKFNSQPITTYEFLRTAEESTRGAFQSIEHVASAFLSIASLLNSTYGAVFNSFRAIISVIEQFKALKHFALYDFVAASQNELSFSAFDTLRIAPKQKLVFSLFLSQLLIFRQPDIRDWLLASWSHAQYLGRIADTLVEAGHEVHFFKFIMDQELNIRNETKKVEKIYIIKASPENSEQLEVKKNPIVTDSFTTKRPIFTCFDHPMTHFAPMMYTACKEILKHRKLLQILEKEQFDVGIAEMFDLCSVAIFHKIGVKTKLAAFAVPLIQLVARKFDIPVFSSFVPNTFAPRLEIKSSFLYRFINFYNEFYDWMWRNDDYILQFEDNLIREEFGKDFPNLKKLLKNVSLVFFNSNPFFEIARPTSNKIVYIGGLVDNLDNEDNKKLEPKIKNILDKATKGAILFSFGSIADTTKLNENIKNAILGAFSRFPNIQFIWKLDNDSIKNMSKLLNSIPNIHTFDWVKQPAILAHPNLKAFITHCGQNSLIESVRANVPIIGLPLFGDQFYNADVAQSRGIGIQIDVNELNGPKGENILFEAIKKILKEPSFRHNVQIISKKLQLTPFKPKERLVKWVEFAAEFEDLSELNLPSDMEMHWLIYYSIDVILFSIIILLFLFWIIWKFTILCLLTIKSIIFKYLQLTIFSNNKKIKNIKKIN
ncbi:UDPGT domain-containing protein [Meloidogyne graminicola]|uniref:glucuronosyltransferase n=1 Tax=Meloidogyne graminicola TaxID=189291 RepID=A0A8T0A2Y5_9BILA|nr:UDPGT domain-containing protein [Meloidogyne graminicola]